jgi:hypothetical protein
MSQVEAPKPLKTWGFGDPFHHAGWLKVADAVIEAPENLKTTPTVGFGDAVAYTPFPLPAS